MNFDLSDDSKAMAEATARALARCCPMDEVRRCLQTPTGEPSRATWQALAELGVVGARVPEALGGSGLGVLDLAACAEQIGRACAPVPMLGSAYLATEALLAWGSARQRARWLPALARGRVTASVGFAPLRPEQGRVGGRIGRVPGGAECGLLVVLHDAGGGACIELDQPGVWRRPLPVLDPGLPLMDIELIDAAAESLDAPPGAATRLREGAAVLLAFEQLGGAERALEMACGYARQRRTFGRPVASYQAIKHLLADVWAANQIARGHAYHAAWALDRGDAVLPLAAAGARVAASEAYEFAARENLQVHGGLGFTWEADCHPFYKRARSTALVLGPVREWKRRITAQLLTRGPGVQHDGL